MQVISVVITIRNNKKISREYIEQELHKYNINPLRWSIVNVSDKICTISVADLKV